MSAILGIKRNEIVDASWVDNGPGWVGVLLKDADAVLALRPGPSELAIGVIGPYPAGSSHAFEVRAFFGSNGTTIEDPVTGSLNASLAQWLISTNRAHPPYLVSQGSRVGRKGRVHVIADPDGTIWIGGGTITSIVGQVDL